MLTYRNIINYMGQPTSIAPLVVFRIVFGLLMLFSTIRYVWMGWVDTQLVDPLLHFSYYGFDWVQPLGRLGMYTVFAIMAFACLGITLGLFYRISAIIFFLCFTYVELIDITYYLNHYYFVSIVAFLFILVPANRFFSLDVKRKPELSLSQVPRWMILIFKLQIAIVYIYAGLAKINYDWLIKALPLSIWLPAKTGIPIIGPIFQYKFTAYLFSWIGMFFDTFIVFGLLYKKTRWLAYVAVIIFHTLTGLLFQIGVFPIVMIFAVTIFFSPSFHERLIKTIGGLFSDTTISFNADHQFKKQSLRVHYSLTYFLVLFFLFQIIFPWRYILYPGNIFWTEEGYRFSWRVMLMEKAGTATFFVKDGENGREGSVINHQFLNSHQEKQMAMQPDLILQFAHNLEEHFKSEGMKNPIVRAEVLVTLNARPAKLLIDPSIDLTTIKDTWGHKKWLTTYRAE
ncbi:HTTM domain-containing protein [Fulvivirga lutea]|uniref:HTTM domain-containing protein n=1 Tax=Fulvivirga lutea TaxID=2810512 RepID=A0A974WFL1_9BACT|nr:HTTM domain-containing protein [Fulvivirga lutea]QSE96202.1 HTTM domain-containing protein [Fulvivirga lutea]